MMHSSKTRASVLGAALLVGLATLGSARSASASSKFPQALQKALNKQFPGVTFCVPTCAACHLTTNGGPKQMNVFGENLERQPPPFNLILGNNGDVDKKVEDAVNKYFTSMPAPGLPTAPANFPGGTRPSYDSDRDGISDYEELKNFDSPSIAGPTGVAQFCPDIAYGCGARIAAAPPPVDRFGLFSAGLVVLGLAAARRLKRTARAG